MGKFLEVIGWILIIGAIGVAIIMVLGASNTRGASPAAAGWLALISAAPVVGFGLVVLVGAAILNDLRAIRSALEWQIANEREKQRKTS